MFTMQFIDSVSQLQFTGFGPVKCFLSNSLDGILGAVCGLERNVSIKQKLDTFQWQPQACNPIKQRPVDRTV